MQTGAPYSAMIPPPAIIRCSAEW